MPEIENVVSMPWKGTPGEATAAISMPWKGIPGSMQTLGGAYTAPASPGGGSAVSPGDLRAATALAPATSYVQAHAQEVVDVRSGLTLPVDGLSIALQDDSVFWQLSASGPDSLFATLTTGEQPVIVSVTLDGLEWQFLVENVSRPRGPDSRRVQFGGRSLAAVADRPFAFPLNYAINDPTTAAQLAAGALLSVGVELEWRIDDWLIPAGTVSLTGTPLEVVRAIAAAVGATVTAHQADLRLTVESRYPTMPNEWASVAPDVQIHSRAVRTENYERVDQPAYTGAIVSGQQGGALGYARLEGTSGAEIAPLVTDQLLTDSPALRERARSILAAGGSKALVTRLLPVRTGAGEPGVLRRGALARCVDQTDSTKIWHGMVRSVSVRAQLPAVEQTVTFERFTKHVIEPDTSPPLVLPGTIPDQELEVGVPFSLDLTPYRTGGAAPYAWATRGGALPPGLAISGEAITGTPTVAGTAADQRLRVTDAVSRMLDTNFFDLVVLPNHRLLTLTFEDTYNCVTTGETFAAGGTVTFDSGGVFGKGVRFHGASSSSSRLISANALDLWDLQSATFDWTIFGWIKADSDLPNVTRNVVVIHADGMNSNQFINLTARKSTDGTQLRLSLTHARAATFSTNVLVSIPFDTGAHFFAFERRGDTLSGSIDGAARAGADGGAAGGTSWTTAATYRSTAGPREIVVGNNTVNTGAMRGMLDSLQIVRGTPFDFVAGFSVPTGPIV